MVKLPHLTLVNHEPQLNVVTLTMQTNILIILKVWKERLTVGSGFGSYFSLNLILKSIATSVR